MRAFFLVIFIFEAPAWGQQPSKPTATPFQNVVALEDMPAEQMGKVMNIMSEALGVSCAHCHAGYDFAKEDAPHKAEARRMIEMTLKLNRDYFQGRSVVSCVTCHQGHTKPPDASLSATQLAQVATSDARLIENKAQPPATDISVRTILDRYLQATGEPKNVTQDAIRKLKGQRIEPDGRREQEDVTLTFPSQWEQITYYGALPVSERFMAGTVQKKAGDRLIELKPDEAAQIRIEALIALGQLPAIFDTWSLLPSVDIDGQAMAVLKATEGSMTHLFYFDQQKGLLTRRSTATPTILGAYVIEAIYADYQMIDGWQVATKTKFRMPSIHWERVLTLDSR